MPGGVPLVCSTCKRHVYRQFADKEWTAGAIYVAVPLLEMTAAAGNRRYA